MEISLTSQIDPAHPPENGTGRYDVRQLKTALNRLGWYAPDPNTGITGDIDAGPMDALHAYQKKNMVFPGDTALGPDSTTERILNEDLARAGGEGAYVWRTVGDGKVRGEHAARNGRTFLWADPPDGENPGEDYNCRCWAEPLNAPFHPWMEWAAERRALHEKLAPALGVDTVPMTDEAMSAIASSLYDPANPSPDAINPTISPLDFVGVSGWGAVTAAKLSGRALMAEIAKKQLQRGEKLSSSNKGPYETASEGGKHGPFLKRYKNVSNKELEKGIRSFDKQINRHLEKIKNPEKEYPDFKKLHQNHQKDLLEKKWPSDIKRLEEEKEILRRILDERN